MNEKHNDATRNRPDGERIIDAQSVVIDMPTYIRQIREEKAWEQNDRNSITVFKNDDTTIVLGAMHVNAELPPHTADATMTLQVLEGGLEINTDNLRARLWPGNIIAINKGCSYNATAIEETLYVLTVTSIR